MDPQGDLVQIVIPCFNAEQFLEETMVSIQHQTHQNFDCLLIDDASTDNSSSIYSSFIESDPRFRVLINQANMGESFSVNAGWRKRTSDLFMIINHDDPQPKNLLESLYRFSTNNPGYLFYYPSRRVIDASGNILRVEILDKWSRFKTQKELITIPSVGTLVDASKFPKSFEPRLDCVRFPSDFAQFYRMSFYGKGKSAPTVLANWREHRNNLSSAPTASFVSDFISGIKLLLIHSGRKPRSLEKASLFGQIFMVYAKSDGCNSAFINAKTDFKSHDLRTSGFELVLVVLFFKWVLRKIKRKIFHAQRVSKLSQ